MDSKEELGFLKSARGRGEGGIVEAYGGELVDLLVGPEQAEKLSQESSAWPSWNLTPRQMCDLELLLNGGFSPLRGFMGKRDYEAVCEGMRLGNGLLWPIPIVLDVDKETARKLESSGMLALRDPEGTILAVVRVEEVWKPDREAEALAVFGTSNPEHPGARWLLLSCNEYYVGGRVEGLQLPVHYDFVPLRRTPKQLRADFARKGWNRVVAFQTRNPLHRAHFELTMRAAVTVGGGLLVHPVVGVTKPGDVDHYTRVRCYKAVMAKYPKGMAELALLPLAMRMAGPREALLHAIIRRNYGCSHLIVGRDHAGPGSGSDGKPFYPPFAAQELMRKHEVELGVTMVPFDQMVYVKQERCYVPLDEVPPGAEYLSISGTELRRRLVAGEEIPEWFTFPEVAEELRRMYPPRWKQGFTVFFTGLSGSGKSTIANALMSRLLELGGRSITLLDGDVVRKHLSSELGFSKEHRDLNILRIGFVAAEVTKAGGIAICAAIAPYDSIRKQVRAEIEKRGGFLLVYMATPLDVCEKRDRKGLYAKARAKLIEQFTGISDPYEPPDDADLVIDATHVSPDEAAQAILDRLKQDGYLVQG